ncbi:unnamed protein product, partial [Iphiclides podalirius]
MDVTSAAMCQVHFGFHRRRTTRKPSGAGATSGRKEGNLYKKSPNPKVERADGQPHRIGGGGNTLLYGDASASSVDPLRTGDHREEGAVPGNAPVPARSSRGKRGRRGRLARPCTIDDQAEGESDGSQVARISATSEDTRKRKAKAPRGDTVAAKYKAVAASASATATEGEDKEDGHDTEEDSQDLSGMKLKSTLPNTEGLGLKLKSQSNRTIESHIDFQLQEIEKVADCSRNLKAAANELARRFSANGIVARLEKENAELRHSFPALPDGW